MISCHLEAVVFLPIIFLVFVADIVQNVGMKEFDANEAKKYLQERDERVKNQHEKERKEILEKVIAILREELKNSEVEVYLVGSIIRPFAFTPRSDVDIVLKNFAEDRFEIWSKLEKKIGKSVEIIPFETCQFPEFVLKEGLKVL